MIILNRLCHHWHSICSTNDLTNKETMTERFNSKILASSEKNWVPVQKACRGHERCFSNSTSHECLETLSSCAVRTLLGHSSVKKHSYLWRKVTGIASWRSSSVPKYIRFRFVPKIWQDCPLLWHRARVKFHLWTLWNSKHHKWVKFSIRDFF